MKSNLQPLVSVCIPTYNGEAFIEEAMQSVITQAYPNLEIIVSDDASIDKTIAIVETYKTKTNIPIHIYNHQPNGIGANWNHCIRQAKGNYIKLLFQDDTLHPDCISKMMTLALSQSKIGLVYCKRSFLYEQASENLDKFIAYYGSLHKHWDSVIVKEGILSGKAYLNDRAFLNSPKNKIGEPSCVLINKVCFETIGFFNEDLQQVLDCEYWYRVMSKYDIGFIDEVLVNFRLHNEQASKINKQRKIPDEDLLYQLYYTNLFKHLHYKNKLKLLKLFHPIVKGLVTIKQLFNGKK